MLGAAVLGLGRIGPSHVKIVASNPNVELKAIADVDEVKLGKVLQDIPKVAGYGDYKDVLERDDIDVVVICLPHWLHEEAAVAAANAGKHILIEKPLADSVAECDRIIKAAQRNNVMLMPAHTQRYYPVVRKTKEILDSGQLGDPIMAVDMWYKPLVPEQRPKWMLDRKTGGGMALMDGVHLIDRMLWIFGPDVQSVSAMVGNPVYPEIPADDTSMAFLRWRDGKVATISRYAYRTGVTYYGADFFCTKGQVKFQIPYGSAGSESVWIGQDGEFKPVEFSKFNSLERQFAEFVEAVSDRREPPISAEHGRQVIKVLEAMDKSSERGREVVFRT
jgi:phthalate 4,5-cis-dihydrodiol dehydrogenase